jgi:hypothetical protein
MSNFIIPSSSDILTQLVNDYIAITTSQGQTINPDPNSETYARLATDAQFGSVMYYNFGVQIDQRIIDTATGPDLDRIANNANIYRRGPVKSQGAIQYLGVTQTITAGALLSGPNSLQYQVSQTGVYSNGQNVPVQSVTAGFNTNLDVGSTLNWINQPFNAQTTATVSVVITGGADAESDDLLRARCLGIIQFPPQAGNASQVQNISALSDALVQQAFVYSDYNNAGTLLICLVGNQTYAYIGRDIPHLPLDNYFIGTTLNATNLPTPSTNIQYGLRNDTTTTTPYNPYAYNVVSGQYILKNAGANLANATSVLYGQLPINLGNSYVTAVTTANNVPCSIAVNLELLYPPNYGGWLNTTTWPNPDGYAVFGYCKVTAITSSTVFTVAAASLSNVGAVSPTAGVTQISWINRCNAQNTGWLVQTATILAATDNNNNTWTITIDQPFTFPSGYTDFYGNTGLTIGDMIFPACANAQTYLTQIMTNFSQLGPGEVTTSTGLQLLGAARFPSSVAQFTDVIDDRFLTSLEVNNNEIIAASFVVNPSTNKKSVFSPINPTTGGYGAMYDNNVYATEPFPSAPPGIYIPYNIGFYDTNQTNLL